MLGKKTSDRGRNPLVWLALYLSLKSKSKNLKTWRKDNIDY